MKTISLFGQAIYISLKGLLIMGFAELTMPVVSLFNRRAGRRYADFVAYRLLIQVAAMRRIKERMK